MLFRPASSFKPPQKSVQLPQCRFELLPRSLLLRHPYSGPAPGQTDRAHSMGADATPSTDPTASPDPRASTESSSPVKAWIEVVTSAWERAKDHAHEYPYVWASYGITAGKPLVTLSIVQCFTYTHVLYSFWQLLRDMTAPQVGMTFPALVSFSSSPKW